MDIRANFIHWYFEQFQLDPLYLAMSKTVEGSPWHRERNVGVHTDMVVSQYLSRSTDFDVRGAIGCAFHDVGKPSSEIIKFKPERGQYRAYHGHELVSARMWEDWAVKNWSFLTEKFGLVPMDIYTINWMIEHHVPWATKDNDKLDGFAATANRTVGDAEVWAHMLMADQVGRISDDSHQRHAECKAWIEDHFIRVGKAAHAWKPYGDKKVFMLVGAPGSGKSTYRLKLLNDYPNAKVISMDDLRLEWYGGDYDQAFAASSNDKHFGARVDALYVDALRNNETLILDNTNTSQKGRKRWLAPAHARDFNVTAVLFPATLDQVQKRQHTRGDKVIPKHVVDDMYKRMSMPMFGDFSDVIVVPDNLPK